MNLLSPVRRFIEPREATPETSLWEDIARGIDDTSRTLRWCKKHLQDRKTAQAMRLAQINLSHLALALDWQMEGKQERAEAALRSIWWQAHVDEAPLILHVPERGC